jgi:signal transduction histidine kinase
LHAAIEGLAEPLRSQNAEVDVRIDLLAEPSPDVAATLYRCAREGLANVAKHAQAKNVTLTLGGDADIVEIELSDDGVGMPETGINGRGEGHFGLQLLRDVAVDLGGEMHVASEPGSGTTLTMWLPMSPILTRQQGSREPG